MTRACVSRIDLSHEYLRAAQTYRLGYPQLKQLSRNSLEYSFLPGDSLWRNLSQVKCWPYAANHTWRQGLVAGVAPMHWAMVAKKAQRQWQAHCWKLHSDSLNETRCGLVVDLLMLCRPNFANSLLLFDIFGMFGAC